MQNLNYLFNKGYYRKIGTGDFENDINRINDKIVNTKFLKGKNYHQCIPGTDKIILKIKYPGVVVGLGNLHGVGKEFGGNDEIKNGFSFDYTTGQPYIPGSSVKGMLRSYFKEHKEVIQEIISKISNKNLSISDIEKLEDDIFVNEDIFFDAVLCEGDKKKRILSIDYITQHKSKIKKPIPLRILRINPGVKLEFRFMLREHKVNEKIITKENLLEIFQELLCVFGVGAKNSVGYGYLETDNLDI